MKLRSEARKGNMESNIGQVTDSEDAGSMENLNVENNSCETVDKAQSIDKAKESEVGDNSEENQTRESEMVTNTENVVQTSTDIRNLGPLEEFMTIFWGNFLR